MKYRKKPVVIDAVQWTGTVESEAETIEVFDRDFERHPDNEDALLIHTLEGDHRADIGDWIIRGVKGEFYPCKPDIFALTYEAVEGDK